MVTEHGAWFMPVSCRPYPPPASARWAVQVHALVRFGPAEGTLARLKWFASISYIVGGHQYSSNDVEHGVLRGNKPSPANILSLIGLSSLAPLTFRQGDPRMQQVCTSSCIVKHSAYASS